ncbi:restriction endonuclease subunit S [Mycolicibacterium porcinum]|uniref:restriction endonuclease subunit S n=1 Tax=Mycolicibacterium porcinum TaxID=39693 RepID=UPI00084851EF|nr:restriction endonuclease subunit S [Mycolicibacterium porcinum]ODR20383.1 hypothetical protein BHQ19_22860 [Mycolicibacterium porcinum]
MTDLPNGWARTTLGEVCEVSPRDPALADDAPFVPMNAVEVGTRWPVSYEVKGSRGGVRAQANDVLFARITPCLENGKVAQLPVDSLPTGGSTEFIVVRPSAAVMPAYVYYWCLHPDVRAGAQSRMAGVTGRMRLSGKDLASFGFQLPPFPEQHRIVEALEDHLSRLDAGEANLMVSAKKAAALRSRAVEATLEASFDRDKAAGERLARIVELRETLVRQRHKVATPPAYQLDLPAGWVTASVDQLCWQIQYGTSTKANVADSGTDVAVLRMGNIQDGEIHVDSLKYLPADDPSLNDLLLEPGDLLFNRTNSAELVGKTAVFTDQLERATFASYLIRCRTVPGVSAQWISYIANSSVGRRYIDSVMSQQVGQANVNGTKLAAMPIPITTADVESALVEEISELRRSSARLATEVCEGLDRSRALRRSLLRAAFNGDLVDQDPSDEPAEVALERLRAESKPVRKRAAKSSAAVAHQG